MRVRYFKEMILESVISEKNREFVNLQEART